jgi:hypothetical protein
MRIDAAGHDDLAAGVDQTFGRVGAEAAGRRYGGDSLAADCHIARGHTRRRHHAVTAYHQVVCHKYLILNSFLKPL